jgi:hypothetical protein
MRYGRRKIGPTFGNKIARLVNVALTAGNRNDYEGYLNARKEIDSMLDVVAEEAGFAPTEEKSEPKQESVPTTKVEPKSKPAAKSKGTAKKATKGAGKRKSTGAGAGDSDAG